MGPTQYSSNIEWENDVERDIEEANADYVFKSQNICPFLKRFSNEMELNRVVTVYNSLNPHMGCGRYGKERKDEKKAVWH